MLRCLLQQRLATPQEIVAATPRPVLKSWCTAWKDRNEETAYLTAWKHIQDKLVAHLNPHGNPFLCFNNNTRQFVSHVNQWQDIVMSFHSDTDLNHLGLKETIERIKQVWTVGAKFYGIPESCIRVCVASCPVCSVASSSSAARCDLVSPFHFLVQITMVFSFSFSMAFVSLVCWVFGYGHFGFTALES